jgi:hypothetical protein
VDKNTDVWQRRPIIGDWMPTLDDDVIYNGLVNWRTLWKDHGPLRVLLDDTENEPKQRGEERVGDGAPEWEEKGSGD